MTGGIGYLYAEQELNEICKLYGYGYGADTSVGATYTIGGPLDTPITRTISDTGARSINVDDINKLADITEDYLKSVEPNYGSSAYPNEEVIYPTIDISKGNLDTGISNNPELKNIIHTGYKYEKSKIPDSVKIKETLFNCNYWLSSRAINSGAPDEFTIGGGTSYIIRFVGEGYVRGPAILGISMKKDGAININNQNRDHAIRPVVTIKGKNINVFNYKKDSESNVNIWSLK